jgi:hypothetical protein
VSFSARLRHVALLECVLRHLKRVAGRRVESDSPEFIAGVPIRRALLAALILTCVAGCGGITDVVGVSPTSHQETGDRVALSPGSRSIAVDGVITTPDPCYEITSSLKRRDRSLDLTLTARRKGSNPCPAVIGYYSYRGEISDLSPGRYQVLVSHVYEGTGWGEKRFEMDVTVGQ